MKLTPILLSVAFVAAVGALVARDETPNEEDQAVENIASSKTERQQKRWVGAVINALGVAIGAAGTGASIWSSVSGLGRAVVVKNHLGQSIWLKCASGDDDLGWRNLQQGEAFMFTFGAHIFGRSHFWCTVWEKSTTFPVYNEGAPTWQKIVYNLRPQAIYFTDNLDSDQGTWFRGWK